jgi:uncharacterized protein DUF4255
VGDFTAISAATFALRTLLERYITNETVAPLAGVPIDLRTPQELRDASVRTAVSLWLYEITRSADLVNQPERRLPPDKLRRRPFPLELHYLVTPIAPSAADEQTLMGRVVQVFHDHSIMRGADIPAAVATELPAELRLHFEPMSLEEMTRVWHSIGGHYQLSASYHVQFVEIESMKQPKQSAPVMLVDAEVVQVLD